MVSRFFCLQLENKKEQVFFFANNRDKLDRGFMNGGKQWSMYCSPLTMGKPILGR